MKNFRILPENYIEPVPQSHLYDVGTHISFQTIGDRLKASINIPVQFA